jgi:hypothetical protein
LREECIGIFKDRFYAGIDLVFFQRAVMGKALADEIPERFQKNRAEEILILVAYFKKLLGCLERLVA